MTVSNQSYTVLTTSNLAATSWISYTNVPGDGYTHNVTVPLAGSSRNFFRLTSP